MLSADCCVASTYYDQASFLRRLLNYKRVEQTNPNVRPSPDTAHECLPQKMPCSCTPQRACQLRANVPRMARSGSSLCPAYSYTQRSRLYGIPRLIRSRKEGRDLLKLGEGEPLASHLPQGGVRALSTPTRAPRHAALKAGADAV